MVGVVVCRVLAILLLAGLGEPAIGHRCGYRACGSSQGFYSHSNYLCMGEVFIDLFIRKLAVEGLLCGKFGLHLVYRPPQSSLHPLFEQLLDIRKGFIQPSFDCNGLKRLL